MEDGPRAMPLPGLGLGTGAAAAGRMHGSMYVGPLPRPLLTLSRWWHVALALATMLLVGWLGATGAMMYARHNAQHADYEAFKAQVVTAINQLAAAQQKAQ